MSGTPDKAPLLEARGLTVGYDGRPVVAGVDLAVAAGSVVTLIGPNGAGKSTMLRTLAGQLDALGGVAFLCGRRLAELSQREQALMRAVLLTERLRTELMICEDVVETGRHPHTGRLGVPQEADREQVRLAMELLEVWDLRDRDFMQLSDGQRQRVMVARAVCQQPRVLLLDEPTSYLDIRYQVSLLRTLRELAATRGLAVVMTLHELSLARQASDWLVGVRDGRVAVQGTPEQVFVPEVIDALYDLEPGMFDPVTATVRVGCVRGRRRDGGGHGHAGDVRGHAGGRAGEGEV